MRFHRHRVTKVGPEVNISFFGRSSVRKTKPGFGFERFEVVVIQRHETFEIKGKLIPAGLDHSDRQASSAGGFDRMPQGCSGKRYFQGP